ncbi:hypothetical protein LP420_11600 [Massilia sp. B-10]|nr:hypothetical protein LP420_11600 [Massilia sp. B-10]
MLKLDVDVEEVRLDAGLRRHQHMMAGREMERDLGMGAGRGEMGPGIAIHVEQADREHALDRIDRLKEDDLCLVRRRGRSRVWTGVSRKCGATGSLAQPPSESAIREERMRSDRFMGTFYTVIGMVVRRRHDTR